MLGRRVVFTGPGKVAVESFEVGKPAEDQILIETLYTSISPGTERAHLLAEPNTYTYNRGFPFYPGYSNIGRILDVGAQVNGYRPGQLVATERPHLSHFLMPAIVGAGVPPEKYRSQFKSAISPDSPYLLHYLIWPLSPNLDQRTLKACSTFSFSKVGLHGVRRARVELGEAVLVIGLGPIGLSAAQYARLFGGCPVIGLDPSSARRKFALERGLDAVYADASEAAAGHPLMASAAPPVVIEATGRPEVIPQAFRLCAHNGRVVLLGSTRGLTHDVNFYTDVHKKGLVVIGVHAMTRPVHESTAGDWTDWDDTSLVLRLICNGRIDCSSLITHEFNAEQAARAYQAVCDSSEAMSVVLGWGD